MAQRMTMLYGFNSPEFFDRTMFENFIDLLRARGVVRIDEGGKLRFDEVLIAGGRRCAARAAGADAPQHPAGHPCLGGGAAGLSPFLKRSFHHT